MITQHGTRRVHVPLLPVLQVLLEPQQLPGWNPAILSLRGPRKPDTGVRYPITVYGGLHGIFEYLDIGGRHVSTTWQVPGFRETGTWYLESRRAATLVRHEYEHHGEQGGPLRTLAGLGLHRLAGWLAATDASRSATTGSAHCGRTRLVDYHDDRFSGGSPRTGSTSA